MSVEKRAVVHPGSSIVGNIFLFIPAIFLVGTVFTGINIGAKNCIIGIFATIISLVVCLTAYAIFASAYRNNLAIKARLAIASVAGRELIYIDTDAFYKGLSAYSTGIAFDGARFHIIDHDYLASFDWSDVRSWNWSIEGYNITKIHGKANLSMRSSVNMSNQSAAHSANLSSGFFIHLSDVEKPVWQYVSINQKLLQKWEEIFNQINEGKINIAA